METALKNSTVWFYRELARRVGGKQMKHWLDTINYGNADTSGGIDKFWLTNTLKISAIEQINFLRNLHSNKLPFTERNLQIVKRILVVKDSAGCKLSAKSGWGSEGKGDAAWYVGYVETNGNVYFFANFIECEDLKNEKFGPARKEIALKILKQRGILK
jgi:beta-lactamase class D